MELRNGVEDVVSLETCFVFFYEMVHQLRPQRRQRRQRRSSGKQRSFYAQVLETGGMHATCGKTQGGQEGEGRMLRPQPLLGFPWERQDRAG